VQAVYQLTKRLILKRRSDYLQEILAVFKRSGEHAATRCHVEHLVMGLSAINW
jgi:hypothetical protein